MTYAVALVLSILMTIYQTIRPSPQPSILVPGPQLGHHMDALPPTEAQTLLSLRESDRAPDWYEDEGVKKYLEDKHCALVKGAAPGPAEVHLVCGRGRVVSRIAPSSAPELLEWLKQFLGE